MLRTIAGFALVGFPLVMLPFVSVAPASPSLARLQSSERTAITLGPIVSAVDETSAIVFVRTRGDASVLAVYSTDPAFSVNVHRSPRVDAHAARDYTAHIPLTDLQPATTYYYRIVVGWRVVPSPVMPHFTTAPPRKSVIDFRFAVFADLISRSGLAAPAYSSAANDGPAFVLQIGDFDHRDPGNPRGGSTVSIENWRAMHRDVLGRTASGQEFAAAIASSFPLYHIWDDHDFGDNNADRTAPWKSLATQAFREYYPTFSLPNADGGFWYSFLYAQVEVFVLDLRSQRDPDDEPDTADKSMLDGAAIAAGQRDWLQAALIASTARWKVLISSSVWNPNSKKVDSWYLFRNEQAALVEFIHQNGITGVVILSGDLHSAGAIDDGTNSFFPELSVPPTNISGPSDCTGGYCGEWSEGVLVGSDRSGYGLVIVEHDETTGVDKMTLQAKDQAGSVRLEYSMELP